MADPHNASFDRLCQSLKPGMRVFLHMGPAESQGLIEAFKRHPDCAAGVNFVGAFIPGINSFDYASLTPTTKATGFFVPPSARASFAAGRFDFVPLHYSQIAPWLAANPVDLAIIHVAPDVNGAFGCGLNADVAAIACKGAKSVVAIVNPLLPQIAGPRSIRRSDVTQIIEHEETPTPHLLAPADDAASLAIARNVAALVRDGDTVQIGLGRLPSAILQALRNHSRLKFYSGMVTDELAELGAAGALDLDDPKALTAGMTIGTKALWDFAAQSKLQLVGTDITHDICAIGALDHFIGINSAIEIDLLGQINCETINGRQISGVGGANDFSRGARLAAHGRSVIALPAVAKTQSRIVPKLSGSITGQLRSDVDIVATEFGTAHLRHMGLDQRAQTLIGLAAPEHRSMLEEQWRDLRNTL